VVAPDELLLDSPIVGKIDRPPCTVVEVGSGSSPRRSRFCELRILTEPEIILCRGGIPQVKLPTEIQEQLFMGGRTVRLAKNRQGKKKSGEATEDEGATTLHASHALNHQYRAP